MEGEGSGRVQTATLDTALHFSLRWHEFLGEEGRWELERRWGFHFHGAGRGGKAVLFQRMGFHSVLWRV